MTSRNHLTFLSGGIEGQLYDAPRLLYGAEAMFSARVIGDKKHAPLAGRRSLAVTNISIACRYLDSLYERAQTCVLEQSIRDRISKSRKRADAALDVSSDGLYEENNISDAQIVTAIQRAHSSARKLVAMFGNEDDLPPREKLDPA